MKIQVIGTGCDDCSKLFSNAQQAVKNTGISAEVVKVEDLMEIVTLGVLTSPSLMIDGKLVISGRAASTAQIEAYLRKEMREQDV